MMRTLGLVVFLLASTAVAAPAEETIVRPFVRGSFAAIVEAGRGRPHIVNFWSIGCPPCLAEMPILKKILESGADVRLTMVSTDAENDIPRILRTLEKYAPAKAEKWVFADTFVERLRYEVDKNWSGELPRTYLIGVNGEIKVESGLLDESALSKWLEGQVK
ncbi:MAG: hypothetical protein A3G18_03375 [Rhodospirillales bacterium RIFCSPLOWO2_12_FULL_58_28]|nr:MAG: hypothetical protein A3H92_03320 [Rhodospirillales bacterium RIFCSPLOWO2_02_FULL_58_16]OHC77318.1 MAG: hypothetical protein A3G18_03375 [Rhodospirillales bacterium RIFCSPLOWO2_12_FULL_58_28]